MRKISIILCVLVFVTLLASCRNDSMAETTANNEKTGLATTGTHFIAKVVEASGNTMLVEITNSETSGITEGSEAWISSQKESNIDYSEFSAGDTVQVYFDGLVMESYPLQINSVTSIGYLGLTNSDEKTVVNIIDKTVNSDICTSDALQGFYEDDRYYYSYSSIRSEYVVVEYSDGSEETVMDALAKGIITIADLDAYNIGYYKEPKNIQNIVYYSDRGGEPDREEVFYTDKEYEYVFPSLRSHVVIVYYKDGTEKLIKEALADGSVLIEDLNLFNIEYYKHLRLDN